MEGIMNITFLVRVFPNYSETFIYNQIAGLLDRGHTVQVIAKLHNNSKIQTNSAGNLKHIPVFFYSELFRIKKYLLHQWLRKALFLLVNSGSVKKSMDAACLFVLLKQNPCDILFCHYGTSGNAAALIAGTGVFRKGVVMFHGFDIRLGMKKGLKFYQKLFQKVDQIYCISSRNTRHLLALQAPLSKLEYHPVGIDLDRFPLKSQLETTDNEVQILSVGRLIESKGFVAAINAIRNLKYRFRNKRIQLRIIGDGPQWKQLSRLINQLSLTENVSLLGAIPNAQLSQFYQSSSFYLMTSSLEVLPVVLMEAQASGLPIVAAKVGSVEEIVLDQKSGFLYDPGIQADLVEKLALLIERRKDWVEMGRVGRKHILDKYDIAKLNQILEAKLINLVHGDKTL
jgi:colanic acid/amylovoran biosynthesis glycosyltransferase